MEVIVDASKGGGNSAGAEVVRAPRSVSSRGSGRSYGAVGPTRKVITPRSPRTVPRIKNTPAQEAKLFREIVQISELRNMMVEADRAYTRIIADGQNTFVAMQKEYFELLKHCRVLSATVAAQG